MGETGGDRAWVSIPIARDERQRRGRLRKPRARSVLILPVDRSEVPRRVFDERLYGPVTLALPVNTRDMPGVIGRRRYRHDEFGLKLSGGQVLLSASAYRVRRDAFRPRREDVLGIPSLPGRPGGTPRAGADIVQWAVEVCNVVGTEVISSAATAAAGEMWRRQKRRKKITVPRLGADEAVADARYHIAIQFPPAIGRDLVLVSVLRTSADGGWVVRLVDVATKRLFEAVGDDEDGSWVIGYAPMSGGPKRAE